MIRDPGSSSSIGFGVPARDLQPIADKTGVDPESGFISRSLHDHPVMRFFAAGAATLAGMAVASHVVRKGGVKLAIKMQESEVPWMTNAIRDIRKTRDLLDEWQGIARDLGYREESDKLFTINPVTGKYYDGNPDLRHGWWFTEGEKQAARSGMGPTPAEWTWRQEFQQRMVSQARRLPYELPAMYVSQRAIVDPLFGTGGEKNKVNWYNPIDVLGDFTTQSLKNIGSLLLPIEGAAGSASLGWRKFMTYGDGLTGLTPAQQNIQMASVGLRTILSRVGINSAELMEKTIRVSAQSTGAFATGVQEAHQATRDLSGWGRGFKTLNRQVTDDVLFGRKTSWEALKARSGYMFQKETLDILPGPFRGLGTGFTAGKNRFVEIGKGYDEYEKLMALGRTRYDASFATRGMAAGAAGPPLPAAMADAQRAAAYEQMRFVLGAGDSAIEELAGRINMLGKGGPSSGAWRQSAFYKGLVQNEYQKQIAKALERDYGVSGQAADKFARISKIMAPGDVDETMHIAQRVQFGKGKIYAATDDEFLEKLKNRLSGFDEPDRNKIVRAISADLVQKTDQKFTNEVFRKGIDRRISQQWNTIQRRLIPEYGERILGGHSRMPFETFAGPTFTAEQSRYLSRRTAQMQGLKMSDVLGGEVGDDVVKDYLRIRGFDPENPFQLRSYLQSKKAIAPAWSVDGRNVFGLKSLTVSDALERGYFRGGGDHETQITRMTGQMAYSDPVSKTMGLLHLKGVYETPTGQIVDFSQLGRRATRFFDKVATSVQIPLIGMKPLETGGAGVLRNWRDRAIIQFNPSMTEQPFLPGGPSATDDFYIWMRRGVRGSKGDVYAVGNTATGTTEVASIPGIYRPFSTDMYDMAARHARLAVGDKGEARDMAAPVPWIGRQVNRLFGEGKYQSFANRMSIDQNQPDSMFRFFQRWKNRKVDPRNPVVMAKLLRDGKVTAGSRTLRLVDNQLVEDGVGVIKSAGEMADAFDEFQTSLRSASFAPRVIRELEKTPELRNFFSFNFAGSNPINFRADRVSIFSLDTPNQIEEAAKKMLSKDASLAARLPEADREALQRAQSTLLWRHLNEATGPAYWDRPVSQGAASSHIVTRADQLKADMLKYLSIREGIVNMDDYNRAIPDIMAKLSELRANGAITQSEFSEAHTALLSTQVNLSSFKQYVRSESPFELQSKIMEDVTSGRINATQALTNIAEGKLGADNPWYADKAISFLRKHNPADYERVGTDYNPFGSDTVFVPTFGTAFDRNGPSAIASVLGFNTWANPKAFSGSSIAASHMFQRLNRYFSIGGLGLDETAFKGPLDFYARGLIGKRILPLTAAGTTAVAVDRTIGGFVNDKDQYGDRVYSPYFIGKAADVVAHGQMLAAGAIPGGQSYGEKKEELTSGEVPVRAGRWWPLGNTPWKGGRVQYYRPSWYRRLKSGYQYTDDTYGSPMERLMFGYDFSPGRLIDPYRFEREHFHDRPYPVTGEYFSGPWGPLTSALNMTVGKVLKPQVKMHRQEVAAGLAQYTRIGEAGAYSPITSGFTMAGTEGGMGMPMSAGMGGGVGSQLGTSSGSYADTGGAIAALGSGGASVWQGGKNQGYSQYSGAVGTGASLTGSAIQGMNDRLVSAAYGMPPSPRGAFPAPIVGAAPPIATSNLGFQSRELGYKLQETFGIYGFAFSAVRNKLGLGNTDLTTNRPVLGSASAAYGSTRGFWDLHLGGMGDVPTPLEGRFSNLEFSEIIRRFVPKARSGIETINPIPNDMGRLYPWLPGSDYYLNFKQGDPYTSVSEGEMRLPGRGYERLHGLHPDYTGKYGIFDQFRILADVAPWSAEFKALNAGITSTNVPYGMADEIQTIRDQVAEKNKAYDFSPYEYKYSSPEEKGMGAIPFAIARGIESFKHKNSYFNTKFLPYATATEDWERNNVYGATFPQWQTPVESYIKPLVYQATQRNPLAASSMLAGVGYLFGSTAQSRVLGGVIGAGLGLGSSIMGKASEFFSGERFLPAARRKELALEENVDILTYIKNMSLSNQAAAMGDTASADQFKTLAQRTMYGADVYKLANDIATQPPERTQDVLNQDIAQLAQAIPKRKREHFMEMIKAPIQERKQILSTAPRLERRIYEAAWGMPVEARPDLEEYFKQHELPPPTWEGWHPNSNMDNVKIKIAQSQGIDLSQMGYYPQQISEANLVNMTYPDFSPPSPQQHIQARLRQLMSRQGISGDVIPVSTPYPGTRVQLNMMG